MQKLYKSGKGCIIINISPQEQLGLPAKRERNQAMRIAIIDQDTNYIKQLGDYCRQTNQQQDIRLYSGLNQYRQAVEKGIDQVILLNQKLLKEIQEQEFDDYHNIYLLLENTWSEQENAYLAALNIEKDKRKEYFIAKYQSAPELLAAIKYKYLSHTQDMIACPQKTNRLAVLYKPYPNPNDSIRLAAYLEKTVKAPCLLVYMDPFQSGSAGEQWGISDLFMAVKQSKGNQETILKELIIRGEGILDTLNGPNHMADIDCLDQGQMNQFIEVLRKTEYLNIILYLSNLHLTDKMVQLVALADVRMVISEDKQIVERFQMQYQGQWEQVTAGSYQELGQWVREVK